MVGIYGLTNQVVSNSTNVSINDQDARLKEVCQEFEALFWMQILKTGRSSVPGGGLFGQSSEQNYYMSLLDQQYSLILAKQDTGLGRMLYEQLRSRV